MNVGIVTTWFERGAAIVSRAYMEALSKDHNVFIYARAGEEYAQNDPKWDRPNVTWGKLVENKIITYVDWNEFKAWVSKNQINIVVFNEQRSWEIILKARKLNILIGAYIDYYTPDTVPFFWLYDFLLCNTQRHYQVFKDHPGAVYIPWGTDLTVFKPFVRQNSDGKVVFFHSCGVSPLRKGTDILVKAFHQVEGNTKLVIHSQGPFVQAPSILSEIVQDSRIELVEKVVGSPGLFYLGDVYVYPTRLEGIGLTIAEALASGLPVITTGSPPMNEFVIDGVNGKLVKVDFYQRRADDYYWPESICNEIALSEAMQFFVDHKAEIHDYQNRARKFADEHLDWDENSRNLASLLQNLSGIRRIYNRRLEKEAMRFEVKQYGTTPFLYSLRTMLIKLGARRLVMLMKRIKKGSIR